MSEKLPFELGPLPSNWQSITKPELAELRIPRPFATSYILPLEVVDQLSQGDPVKYAEIVSQSVILYMAGGKWEAPIGGWLVNLVTGEVLS
jgi:hypothetical protein